MLGLDRYSKPSYNENNKQFQIENQVNRNKREFCNMNNCSFKIRMKLDFNTII